MLLDLRSLYETQQVQQQAPPPVAASLAGWMAPARNPRMVERKFPRPILSAGLEAWLPFVEAGVLSMEEAVLLASAQPS